MASRWPPISDTELEVLKVLWEQGPATVREVNALLRRQGRRWAYTTVLTLLQRLEAKGYVASDKSALAHVFRADVSRDRLLRRRLKDLASQLCQGTTTPLVQALVEGHRFTAAEIDHFRRLLDRLAREQGS
ncbi:MAG TPA: BlaI/MecI/CopY family transcriptional regulator [Gemmataceae bacterium]|nr:BlaI/MecI/CopY family transcriptional regulator [Gemmataceae bacterium]